MLILFQQNIYNNNKAKFQPGRTLKGINYVYHLVSLILYIFAHNSKYSKIAFLTGENHSENIAQEEASLYGREWQVFRRVYDEEIYFARYFIEKNGYSCSNSTENRYRISFRSTYR